MWHKIFFKIHGYAIGIDTFQKVKDLAALFQNYVSPSITVGLKIYDLNIILALTGVEMSEISLPTLTLMFTGDILPTPTQFNVEIGKFCGIYLPEYLNIHLQLKSIAIMNIATICKLSILVNLFPTPGIACLVTRMTPTRFFAWFSTVFSRILQDMYLPMEILTDRYDKLDEKLTFLKTCSGKKPYFSPADIVTFMPTWPSIAYGGCTTDSTAIVYLNDTIRPIFCRPGIPPHLRWFSDKSLIQGIFSQPAGAPSVELLGCRFDQSLPDLPDISFNLAESMSDIANRFLNTLQPASPLFGSTANQIILLYLWKHPAKSKFLYSEILALPSNYLAVIQSTQITFMAPIIFSYSGEEEVFPKSYKTYLGKRKKSHDYRKVTYHAKKFAKSESTTVKADSYKKLKRIVVKKYGISTQTFNSAALNTEANPGTNSGEENRASDLESISSTDMTAYLEDSESGACGLQSPQHQKPVDSLDEKYIARSPTASEIDRILNPTDSDSEVCASTDSVYGKYNPMSPTASETDLILDAPNLPAEVLMNSNFC